MKLRDVPPIVVAVALATACGSSSPPAPKGRQVLMGSESAVPGQAQQAAPDEAPPQRRRQPTLDTKATDRRVGKEAADQVARDMRFIDDEDLQEYVSLVGERVAKQAPRQGFDSEFHVVDQDAPHAFSLPGGFIYVSRGLLALANVLGHEIMHVVGRHAAARQQMQRQTANPMMLPGVILGSILGGKVGRATTEPFRNFNAPYVAAFSRDQERSADRGGQEFAARAGYDPHGMSKFLEGLAENERYRLGYSRLPGFMDTHPGTRERVASTGANAQMIPSRRKPGIAVDGDDYVRRLDGVVDGTSAAEGVFVGDRFFHPDLDFTLRFPHGWRLVNAQHAVGAISPKRDVQLFLSAPTPGDDPRAVAEVFIEKHRKRIGLSIKEASDMKIGAMDAYRITASASTGGMRIGGQVTWIAYDGLVYRFTAVAPAGTGRGYIGRAQNAARSFRPLTPEECKSIEETRLRVVKARKGEGLAGLSERTGNVWSVPRTGIMNDHVSSAPLANDQLIKIARTEPYRPKKGCAEKL